MQLYETELAKLFLRICCELNACTFELSEFYWEAHLNQT